VRKVLLSPGAFNPFHVHHWYQMELAGREYEVSNGVLIPAYKHPEKNELLDLEKRVEIIETFIWEVPFSFPVEISDDERRTESTGRTIIDMCEGMKGEKYLILGLDTVLEKFEQMEDYEEILKRVTLIVNDYDSEILEVKKYLKEIHINTKSGEITLPVGKEKIKIWRNPFSGLHSTDIRRDPEKYLRLYPKKTKELIKEYYKN